MACGPDYGPDVFVPANQPEKPALFAQGRLGVLQSGYFHAELVVAYRYLSGARLSNTEKDAYSPPELSPDELAAYRAQREARVAARPINRWLKAREDAHASPPAAEVQIAQDRVIETKRDDWVERDDQLNCPDAAYATAADSLESRLKTWGAHAMMIPGQASDWVYLHVHDGQVELKDATHLLGQTTSDTERLIKEELNKRDKQMSVLSIGPAGEHLVKFACAVADGGHVAAHNGIGAVMGSKKVKAIAVEPGLLRNPSER